MTLVILLFALAAFMLYLVYEARALRGHRDRIPLVVAVTGTRGKSSVARLLASVLREGGHRVLAKTTGSQAQFVLPDGSIQDIPRRGVASVIEQKEVLKKAVGAGVNCLVVEIMSIREENHYIESHRILKPNTVVLTNIRRDHMDAMGETEDEIGRVLAIDIPPGARAYIPEELRRNVTQHLTNSEQCKIVAVPPGRADVLASRHPELRNREFAENLDLVAAVATDQGIDDETIVRGMLKAIYDIGKFKVWKCRVGDKQILLANAFAANDPESTLKVIEKIRSMVPNGSAGITGLLSLRGDRGDRTLQWVAALKNGMSAHFRRVHVVGDHARAVRRSLKNVDVLRSVDAEEITVNIAAGMEDRGVLLGFGNIGGVGKMLVEYWQRVGEEYGI